DKPHFPFWLTAMSFKMWGITSFAYILPGFLFYLLGVYYTYRLAKHLYNPEVGLLACLISLSSFHLLLSSIDVRAEAYLVGQIMPACYYWYLYHERPGITVKYLILGALFTALAMMTKGVFVLVPITSGLIGMWIYTRQLNNLVRLKWLLALLLSFIFIAPELIALYLQFDAHPEKIVFGTTRVSGLRWFFWDSQFGRFFNSGPITANHVSTFHYLFFVHTFLWAFLPWSIIFIAAGYNTFNLFRAKTESTFLPQHQYRQIYLWASFLPTFILFSATSFQLDHYTNILMPFAALICSTWFYHQRVNYAKRSHPLFYFQIWFALLLTVTVIVLSLLVFGSQWLGLIVAIGLGMILLFIIFTHRDDLTKAILYPVLAICLTFVFIMLVNGEVYAKYDAGYQIAKLLNQRPALLVVDYKVNSLTLEFHSKDKYERLTTPEQLKQLPRPYYLIINNSELPAINKELPGSIKVLAHVHGTTVDKVMVHLLAKPRLKADLIDYAVVVVN
ncbi:MAG: ArnT family glycosyltransferase, partial [Burkholderiales bacterium]